MAPSTTTRASCLLLVLATAMAGACSESSQDPAAAESVPVMPPPVPDTPVPAFAEPAQSFGCRSLYPSNPGFTDDQYAQIAAMPMAMFELRWCLSAEAVPVIAELRRRNPDIVIIGTQPVLAVRLDWDEPGLRARFPMVGELYDLLIDHVASTDLGEEVWMWDGTRMLNPMRHGRVDEQLLSASLDIISRHATLYPGHIDGVMHDYTSPGPWPWPDGFATHEGAIDFDGDGTGFVDDSDERAAWVQWQYALCDQLQERFGPGFVQIANGRLVLDDPLLARRVAGAAIQKFPFTVWNWSAEQGLQVALRLREQGWLTPRRGQYWTVYFSATSYIDGQTAFRRYASALTGDLYETNTTTAQNFVGADPDRPELGRALGPMSITRTDLGSLYSREFESGSVYIEFSDSGSLTDSGILPPASVIRSGDPAPAPAARPGADERSRTEGR